MNFTAQQRDFKLREDSEDATPCAVDALCEKSAGYRD
jgi:hypothetical protein